MRYFFITIILLVSCKNNNDKIYNITPDHIISMPGIYYVKNYKISVKEFKNGSLVFAISDKKNKLYFQQSILESFNKLSLWGLYVDENDNLWFFNSDYNKTDVWIRNDDSSTGYEKKNFCKEQLALPARFEFYLLESTEKVCVDFKNNP
ncbi:hypothetical protein MHTCC0001_15500 [Flavobacteriaceae bacterium MHTCC 0001]